jgi:hypothetical protein
VTLQQIFLKSSEWDQSTQNFMLIQLKNVQNRKIQKTLAQSILRASIVQVYSKSYKPPNFLHFLFMTFFQAEKNSGVLDSFVADADRILCAMPKLSEDTIV